MDRTHRVFWRQLIVGVAVVVGLAFALGEALLLNVRIRDFDEGVYWQSIRAMARDEALFSSIFASQPPGFYYALLPLYMLGRSLLSLRLSVLVIGLVGLAAAYVAGRALAGPVAGLIAVLLAATSPLYFHEAAIVQADGPSVALGMLAVALAILAVRARGRRASLLAAASGLALAMSVGIKFLGAVTIVPVAIVLLGVPRCRLRLFTSAVVGGLVGLVVVFLPALVAPRPAFDDLVLIHLRAGQLGQQGLMDNVRLILLHRELPLEVLAAIGVLFAVLRRERAIVAPLAWLVVSILAALFYHPLFLHHAVMLSLPLALTAAIGLTPRPDAPPVMVVATGALVAVTAAAGIYVANGDVKLALVPDLHDMEMAGAVRSLGHPGDFWISDNPFAVAAADRDLPGPVVDTSTQRTHAGLLTVDVLEAARRRYHVRWLLEDSFRLDIVPGYRAWLHEHFHAVRQLGGGAVIYEAD